MRRVFAILAGWVYPRSKNPAYEEAAMRVFWMLAAAILVVMLIVWVAT